MRSSPSQTNDVARPMPPLYRVTSVFADQRLTGGLSFGFKRVEILAARSTAQACKLHMFELPEYVAAPLLADL
jgi:hypothetical protein